MKQGGRVVIRHESLLDKNYRKREYECYRLICTLEEG